jgi:predicted outer membrane protein
VLLAGCGGSDSSDKTASTTTPSSHGQTIVTKRPPAALPTGDAGYLTTEVERSTSESFAAGIANGRASSGVKGYARKALRQRASIAQEDARLAVQLKLRLRPHVTAGAELEALRKLAPLTGARFDDAYLAFEAKSLPGDISRAAQAAKRAASARTRSLAAKHLAVFRAQLAAVRSLTGS